MTKLNTELLRLETVPMSGNDQAYAAATTSRITITRARAERVAKRLSAGREIDVGNGVMCERKRPALLCRGSTSLRRAPERENAAVAKGEHDAAILRTAEPYEPS